MSESYQPGPDVSATYPYETVFLSQRDLGLTVPINFVTVPGVSFSAACFPSLNFEDDNSGDCLSNLLAIGFRRFEIDLYWDQGRQLWSFCPVAIPSDIIAPAQGTETLSFSTSSVSSSTSAVNTNTSAAQVTARQDSSAKLSSAVLATSQSTAGTSSASISSITSAAAAAAASSLGQDAPPSSSIPSSDNNPLVKIGPYVCTTTINLSTFTSQMLSFIKQTQDNVHAQMVYVIINVHAAASDSSPTSPAPSPTVLPLPGELIGFQFDSNLSSYMYTPTLLRSDRANLNSSWYSVPGLYRPADGYYETNSTQNGIVTSENGWPTEYSAEFWRGRRLLLGWGIIDPQLSGYNFTGDGAYIFPEGYIQNTQSNNNSSSAGQLSGECFFRSRTDNISISQVNSSWATDSNLVGFDYPLSATSDITPLLNLTTNTTNCGISSILNFTLLNATAQNNPFPYEDYIHATIWSWAPGEPKNSTSDSLFRCATSNPDLNGRWIVNDCSQKYYTACRATGQPYNWTITSYPVSYSYASQTCPDNYSFGAPRTALENSYLTQAIRDSHRDYDGHGVWVNFNSLDYQSCWVTGGPNATCPYKDSVNHADDLRHRTVLVPALAALIVLIITTLTIVAKFFGNRKTKKRTAKRANNGFIYEGVPS